MHERGISVSDIFPHTKSQIPSMTIENRAAELLYDPAPMTDIIPPVATLLPDIPAGESGGGQPLATQLGPTPTASYGLLTETAPFSASSTKLRSSSIPTQIPTPIPTTIPTTVAVTASSATPTNEATTSHGLSQERLVAAIIVPIALVCVLIPSIILSICFYRRRQRNRETPNHRSSYSREPMVQKEAPYRGSSSRHPYKIHSRRSSPTHSIQEPEAAQTRNSLGLFNFGLSPTTPSTSRSQPGSQGSRSPGFRFSTARALEMRRSQPNVVQPYAQTSDAREPSPPYTTNATSPQSGGSRREDRRSIFDPPPPYATSRPHEDDQGRSHFAPLSRIGTRNQGDRSRPQPARQVTSPEIGSSNATQGPNTYGRMHTRSDSYALQSSVPQLSHPVAPRKPVPTQGPRAPPHETSPQSDAHLDGPFSSYLPERMPSISAFSIDTTRWEDNPRHESISSNVSQMDNDIATMHPYHPV